MAFFNEEYFLDGLVANLKKTRYHILKIKIYFLMKNIIKL